MGRSNDFSIYVLTCGARVRQGITQRTLASIAASDWGAEPHVQLDTGESGDPKSGQTENYRRLLERIARDRPGYALVLEDDVVVNRHLRANLSCWAPVRSANRYSLGSLYNPNITPLAGAAPMAAGFVADPESVYGSQAFLLTPELAEFCLAHWGEIPAMQDIKVSRLAARVGEVVMHTPSLVQHHGATTSTHGGAIHTAPDYDPWWRSGEPSGGAPESWHRIPGWYDWASFYEAQVDALPHGAAVVEIGVYLGRSVIHLAQTMKARRKDLRLHAVNVYADGNSALAAGSAGREGGTSICAAFTLNLERCGVADAVSVMEPTTYLAAQHFADGSLNLVFVDGDHTEDGFARDLLYWLPKICPGGILAGHDILTFESVGRTLDRILGTGRYGVDPVQNLWTCHKPG
jgi:hypothetical protein